MDLTTELLDNAAFREAKRGYNTQEVDEFIEQVKVEYGRHDAMVREAKQRVDAAEARVADAERRAAEAAERAAATSDDDDTLKRTLDPGAAHRRRGDQGGGRAGGPHAGVRSGPGGPDAR